MACVSTSITVGVDGGKSLVAKDILAARLTCVDTSVTGRINTCIARRAIDCETAYTRVVASVSGGVDCNLVGRAEDLESTCTGIRAAVPIRIGGDSALSAFDLLRAGDLHFRRLRVFHQFLRLCLFLRKRIQCDFVALLESGFALSLGLERFVLGGDFGTAGIECGVASCGG